MVVVCNSNVLPLGEANEILELLQRLSYELLLNHRKGMLGDDKLKPPEKQWPPVQELAAFLGRLGSRQRHLSRSSAAEALGSYG